MRVATTLGTIDEKDAEGTIAFTREYFHHVYVMPALLKAYEETPAPPSNALTSTLASKK